MFNSNNPSQNRYSGNNNQPSTSGSLSSTSSGSTTTNVLGSIPRSLGTNPPMSGYAAVASYNPNNPNNNNLNNNNNGLVSLRPSTSTSGTTINQSSLSSLNTSNTMNNNPSNTNNNLSMNNNRNTNNLSGAFSPINMNTLSSSNTNRLSNNNTLLSSSTTSSSSLMTSNTTTNTLRANTTTNTSSSSLSSTSNANNIPTGNDILNLLNNKYNPSTASSSGSNVSSNTPLPPPGLGGTNPSNSFRNALGNNPSSSSMNNNIDDNNLISFSMDNYGLQGLLSLVRTPEKDIQSLVLGNDLTQIGLNLASADPLHATFATPWAKETTISTLTNNNNSNLYEPYYTLPHCYRLPQPALKTGHLSKFDITTLMYIFYAMPKDILQAYAAQELYVREWRYHRDNRLWYKLLTNTNDNTTTNANRNTTPTTNLSYVYFDINVWDRRPYMGISTTLANGFLTEEECRVKVSASTTTATGTTPSIPGVSTGSSSVSSLGGT